MVECRLRDGAKVPLVVYAEIYRQVELIEQGGPKVLSKTPNLSALFHRRTSGGHTGVMVVSSHPQSTTKPVMRPHAPSARRLADVNAIEGTCLVSL